jgi:hypothetical protein
VLASLPLEEVHLGPLHDRALTGLDALRHLTSIRQLGTAADQVMPPGPFWAGVDAGDHSLTSPVCRCGRGA